MAVRHGAAWERTRFFRASLNTALARGKQRDAAGPPAQAPGAGRTAPRRGPATKPCPGPRPAERNPRAEPRQLPAPGPPHLEVAAVLRGVLQRPERPHQLRQLLRHLAGRGGRRAGLRGASELLQRQELGEQLGVAEALQDGVHEAGVAVVAQPRHAGHRLGAALGRRGLGAARRARREAAAQAAGGSRRGQARGLRAAGLGLAAVVRERGEGLQHAAHEAAERPPRRRGRGGGGGGGAGGRGGGRAAGRRPPAEEPLAEGALLLGAARRPGAAHPRHGRAAPRASPRPARPGPLRARPAAASRRRHAAGGAGRGVTCPRRHPRAGLTPRRRRHL